MEAGVTLAGWSLCTGGAARGLAAALRGAAEAGRRARLVVALALLTAGLFGSGAASAATIAQNGVGATGSGFAGGIGQSITTPSGGAGWDHITLNFYSSSTGAPIAAGNVYLLSSAYAGTPAGLSTSTPGFLGVAAASGSLYSFTSSLTLQPATTYYVYADTRPGGAGGTTITSNTYAGGVYYNSPNGSGNFGASACCDLAFLLQGTALPASVTGTVSIGPDPFTAGQTVTITVNDADLNTNAASAETVNVTVSSSNGESEVVTLTETGVNTGVFTGTLDTAIGIGAGAANDGTMNAESADVLTATYVDALDGSGAGPTDRTDTATGSVDAYQVVTQTLRVISNFLSSRADMIAAAGPDLTERLTSSGGTESTLPLGFTAGGVPERFALAFSTSLGRIAGGAAPEGALGEVLAYAGPGGPGAPGARAPGLDIWVKGRWAHSDAPGGATDFGLLHFGLDYLVNPSLLVGVLGQIDWTNQKDQTAGTAADGIGWIAGPYLVARLRQNLILEARAAWGQSANHVNPLGVYADAFDTDRWLASGALTGDFGRGNWRFSPRIAALYFGENQKPYVDSLGITIPGQTVSLGRVTFGPKVSYVMRGEWATIEPHLAVNGIWDFDRAETVNVASGLAPGSAWEIRARVEGGLSVRLKNGWLFSGDGFYDGIGAGSLVGYGGSVKLAVPLR